MLMRLSVIIFFVFITINTFSQSKVDSLKQLAATEKGEKLVDVYNQLSDYYKQINRDSALMYSFKALKIANQNKYIKGSIDAQYNIAVVKMYQQELDTALKTANTLLKYIQLNKDNNSLAKTFNITGLIYKNLQSYDSAMYCFDKTIEYSKLTNDSLQIAYTNNNIALILIAQYKYKDAILKLQKTIEILNLLGKEKETASPINNIGLIYNKIGQQEKAIEYYKKAVKLFRKNNMFIEAVRTDINIGNAFIKAVDKSLKSNNIDSCILYYNKALKNAKELDNEFLVCATLGSLGVLYTDIKQYDKAVFYTDEAVKMAKKLNVLSTLPNLLANKANLHRIKGDYTNALKYNDEAYKLLLEKPNLVDLQNCIHQYYHIYKGKEDYKKALEYLIQSYDLNDSIFIKQKNKDIHEIETKYRLDIKEKELKLLDVENQKNIESLKSERKILYLFVVMFSLVFIGIFVIILQSIKRKKANVILKKSNEIIQEQSTRMKIIITDLETSNATKDKFFSIIAHDLKNPFGSILSITQLLTTTKIKMNDAKKNEILSELNKAAKSTYLLLENLLTWARSQKGEIIIQPERVDLHGLIQDSIESLLNVAMTKNITLNNTIAKSIDIKVDINTMKIVINNLVSNAIKFTPTNGEISINALQKDKSIEIYIADSGVGMTPEQIEKLFKIDKSQSTLGTNKEKGTGLGLILCKEFVEKNGGKISVESEKGNGSKFVISLPY